MTHQDDHPTDYVIAVDWSASSTKGPRRPSPDRCWLAAGHVDTPAADRPEPEYFRTRMECERRIIEQAERAATSSRGVLIGLDFPIGYPLSTESREVLPTGRRLCSLLGDLVADEPSGANNRFEVAEELNRQIKAQTGRREAPFWGHPVGREYADLTFRKTRDTGVHEYRAVERQLRNQRLNIQSAWKLSGAGSVGSQSILGLAMVDRILDRFGEVSRLWPFDASESHNSCDPGSVTVAEIWPTLGNEAAVDHPVKDARQVVAMRDAMLDDKIVRATLAVNCSSEGWIVGVSPTTPSPPASA